MIIVAVLAVLAVSSVWVVFSRRAQPSSSEDNPFPSSVQKQLDSALDTTMKNADVPGAIVGVWVPGKGSWVATRGVADTATRKPVATGDLVRIGSITKTFVATVVLQLVDQKIIGLTTRCRSTSPPCPAPAR
jgi:D-alanyl-D-alanine carboxypeptidase